MHVVAQAKYSAARRLSVAACCRWLLEAPRDTLSLPLPPPPPPPSSQREPATNRQRPKNQSATCSIQTATRCVRLTQLPPATRRCDCCSRAAVAKSDDGSDSSVDLCRSRAAARQVARSCRRLDYVRRRRGLTLRNLNRSAGGGGGGGCRCRFSCARRRPVTQRLWRAFGERTNERQACDKWAESCLSSHHSARLALAAPTVSLRQAHGARH